jgi:hypothetical protein
MHRASVFGPSKILRWALVFMAGAVLVSLQLFDSALAQSGYQTINGTQVFTVIDQGRGVATFSNSCGSQSLTQRQLQAGAIPTDIIPCPRPGRSAGPVRHSEPISRKQAERECGYAKEDLEKADEKHENQAAIEKAVREIRNKCPIAGMHDAVAWANTKMLHLKSAIRLKEQAKARLKEARETVDPQRSFDATLLATRADRLFHEGNYQKAASLLLSAIETYRSIGQPVTAAGLEKQLARFSCKAAIDTAQGKEGTSEASALWRKAKDACSKFPDDLAIAQSSLKRALEIAAAVPTVNPKTTTTGVTAPKVSNPTVVVPTVTITKPEAGLPSPPTAKAPKVRTVTVKAPTVNVPKPKTGSATPPTVIPPKVRTETSQVPTVNVSKPNLELGTPPAVRSPTVRTSPPKVTPSEVPAPSNATP